MTNAWIYSNVYGLQSADYINEAVILLWMYPYDMTLFKAYSL